MVVYPVKAFDTVATSYLVCRIVEEERSHNVSIASIPVQGASRVSSERGPGYAAATLVLEEPFRQVCTVNSNVSMKAVCDGSITSTGMLESKRHCSIISETAGPRQYLHQWAQCLT